MERELQYYFLQDDEFDKVVDDDSAEDLLISKGIEPTNVKFDGDDMITYYEDDADNFAPDAMDLAKERDLMYS